MNDFQHDEPDFETEPTPLDVTASLELPTHGTSSVSEPVATAIAGIDLVEFAGELVVSTLTKELQRQVQDEVAPIVKEAVATVLTPERLEILRELATAQAEAEITPQQPELSTVSEPIAETQPEPELLYATMEQFLTDYLTLMYEIPMPNGRRTWCPEWWKHAGAVIRIQALWMSWEDARKNGGLSGLASWIVNHADPITTVLFDVDGVFKSCSIERGHRADRPNPEGRLPTEPAPEDLLTQRP